VKNRTTPDSWKKECQAMPGAARKNRTITFLVQALQ
jgi:hypothetical protein